MADISLHACCLILIAVPVVFAPYLLLHMVRPNKMYMPMLAANLQAVTRFSFLLRKETDATTYDLVSKCRQAV